MSKISGYSCKSCAKVYTHKYNYERHIVCCEFFNKTLHDHEYEAESIELPPDTYSLYQLVKELAVRVTKVEKENAQLKQQLSRRNKVNVLDYLNKLPKEHRPEQSFTYWFENNVLPAVHLQLEDVYSNGLISGIVSTWKSALSCSGKILPIKAFDNRVNTFYVYEEEDNGVFTWSILTAALFDKHLRRVCKQFIVDFKQHWFDKNEEKINEDEKWTNMYVDYYQKILGGSRNTTEGICQKVRHQLYTHIKVAFIPSIEVNFS